MFKLVLNLSLLMGAIHVHAKAARSHDQLDEIQGRGVDFLSAKLRDPDTSLHIDGKKRQASSVQLSRQRIEDIDCYEHDGANYRGTKATTRYGRTCQSWGSQSPHSHKYTPSKYPSSDLKSNYCRNPNGDLRPWCYTTDSKIKWEYCGIPKCTGEAAYLSINPPKPTRYSKESVVFFCEGHPGKESRYDEVNYPTGLHWKGPDGATIGPTTSTKPLRIYTEMYNNVQIALHIKNLQPSDAGDYTCLAYAGRRTVKRSVRFNVHIPFVIKEKLPWKNAQKACQDRGGDLMMVPSPADHKDLIKYLDQHLKSKSDGSYLDSRTTSYYVGAKKADVGEYRWVKTGKKVSCNSPFLWSTRPTSSCKGSWASFEATCLAIAMGDLIEPKGAFIDVACKKRQYILCEKIGEKS